MPATHPVAALFDVLEGPIRFALVSWAIEHRVFDLCETPKTAQMVAERLKASPERAELTLRGLSSLGVLDCRDGGYCLSPGFAPYLLTASEKSFVPTFIALADLRHRGLDDLTHIIARKDDATSGGALDADHWQNTQMSLAAFHRSVASDTMLGQLTALPEWPAARSMLDVGGGSLELGRKVARSRPDFEVTLFDLPQMVEQLIGAEKSNLTVVGGDYNDAASLPKESFDIIWCSMSLYFADRLSGVLDGLKKVLAPGGVLVSFHEDLRPDRCGPSRHVIGRMMPSLRGLDVSFSDGMIAKSMKDIGFASVETALCETPFGPYRVDIGRMERPPCAS